MIRRYSVTAGGRARAVEVEELEAGHWRVSVDGKETRLALRVPAAGLFSWLDGTSVVEASIDGVSPRLSVGLRGQVIPVEISDGQAAVAATERPRAAGPAAVRAPIPGRVVRVLVKAGEVVAAGRGVIVLEAMKMENELRAPRDGTVKLVSCVEGAAVEAGQTLITLE